MNAHIPYFDAFFQIGGDRLFQKQIVSDLKPLYGVPVMVGVLRGNDEQIRHFTFAEKLLFVGKQTIVRNAVFVFCNLQFLQIRIANGNNVYVPFFEKVSIILPACTESDNCYVHIRLLVKCFIFKSARRRTRRFSRLAFRWGGALFSVNPQL